MSLLIKLLILFFIVLIIYQLFLAYFNYRIEGLDTYQEYDTKNPDNAMILIQKNSGNIEVLRDQLNSVMGLNKQVQDISGNVAGLQVQVDNLVQAQMEYASQNYPSSTPEISGVVEDGTTDETDFNESGVNETEETDVNVTNIDVTE